MALTQWEKRRSKMFEPKFTISNSITNALLEIERARGFLDAAKLIKKFVIQLKEQPRETSPTL